MTVHVRMRKKRGSVMVEFALLSPLALLLLAGCLDFGLLLRNALRVSDAARSGARYGSTSTARVNDTSGMQSAALNTAPNLSGLTATAAKACYCSDGTSVACNGSCASGGVRVYAKVTVRATSPTIFNYSRLPFSGSLSTEALMRIQ